MSAELKPRQIRKKWGMEMSDSLRTALTIRILVGYLIFDTIADFL